MQHITLSRTSRMRSFFFLSFLLISQTLWATPIDHLRLTWSDDPSSTINMIWSPTDGSGEDHIVYYDTQDFGGQTHRYRNRASVQFTRSAFGLQNAYVRIKNLKPATRYYFVIASDTKISRRYFFHTISDSMDAQLSVIAGGDSRNNRIVRRRGNRIVSKLRADVVLFAGDMTAFGTGFEWRNWFGDWQLTFSPDGRVTPIVAARGNHEKFDEMLAHLFDTPEKVYYALNFGGDLFRVYTLNSESVIGGAQTNWLENELKNEKGSSALWKFAQYHVPMRPHTRSKTPGAHQYRYWAPLFEQHGMDLVLEADSHTVKMTYPIVPSTGAGSVDGFIRDDAKGTIYIGEGTWGAPLRKNNNDRPWTWASGSFSQFKWLQVTRENINMKTVVINDPDDVDSVKDEDRFAVPKGLELWSVGVDMGKSVVLQPRKTSAKGILSDAL